MSDETTCPECGTEMQEHRENNGFTMPEGPEHWDITFICPNCGHEE